MSLTDALWIFLPALAGVVIGTKLPSRVAALMLGPAVLLVAFVLFVYALGTYENCEAGQPCPTGERVIDIVNPILFWGGSALFVVGLVRYVWFWWRSVRMRSSPGRL